MIPYGVWGEECVCRGEDRKEEKEAVRDFGHVLPSQGISIKGDPIHVCKLLCYVGADSQTKELIPK